MRFYKWGIIPLILLSCIASVFFFFSAYSAIDGWWLEFNFISPIIVNASYILLLLLHFIVLRHRTAFKPLSIFIFLTMLSLTVYTYSVSYYEFIPSGSLTFTIFISIILTAFIGVGTYGFFLLISALARRDQPDLTLKVKVCFFLLLYIFLIIFLFKVSDLEIFDHLGIFYLFNQIMYPILEGFLLPGIIALSMFLTLLNIMFSRIRHDYKKQYDPLIRLLFSLSASISSINIISKITNSNFNYDYLDHFFQAITSITFFFCIFLFLLFHLVNRKRNRLRSILILTSIIFFITYILINISYEIKNSLYMLNAPQLNNNDADLIKHFYYSVPSNFMNSLQLILIFISFLILLLLIFYFKFNKIHSIFRKLMIVIAIFLCIINLSISLYAFNVRTKISYPGGSGANVFGDLIASNLDVIASPNPKSTQGMKVNYPYQFSLKLIAKDGNTPLNRLQAQVTGTPSSFVNLLGKQNKDCILATLDYDSEKFNVSPPQTQEYPLEQESITWNWIVTPKQVGNQIIRMDIEVVGGHQCTSGSVESGSYSFANPPVYAFNVFDPNSNIFTQILQGISFPEVVSATLSGILTAFIIWICKGLWPPIRNNLQRNRLKQVEQNAVALGNQTSRNNYD